MSNLYSQRSRATALSAFERLFNRGDYAGRRRPVAELKPARRRHGSRSGWSTVRFAAALLVMLASFAAGLNPHRLGLVAVGVEVYRHFESKEELAGDAFDHAWKIAMDMRFQGTDKIPNSVDRLKQIVRNFRDRRTGQVPGGCPLLNTAIDSDDGNAHASESSPGSQFLA